MKRFDEWRMPDHEEHLQFWMQEVMDKRNGRLLYQGHKYRAALTHCTQFRRAVDVGAHIGLWSFMMALDFAAVECFEPVAAHRECWFENMKDYPQAVMHAKALGKEHGFVNLATYTPNSSGDTRVSNQSAAHEDGAVELVTLDSLELQDVDFMKIDCEGYEEFVLRGAKETIVRCKPIIIVEQKRDHATNFGLKPQGAVEYLETLGAKRISDVGGDYILGWQ